MPNGNSYANPFIFPNLKKVSQKEAMTKDWYVGCKFYDPTQKDKYPKGYFWRKKGLAEYKTFKERSEAAKILMEEMQRALDRGFNPMPNISSFQSCDDGEFSPNLYLIEALDLAFNDHKVDISKGYKQSIESNLKTIKPVILKLKMDHLKIKDVELKHIKKVLDNCNLTAYSYNKFRKHLSVLFKKLCANSCLIQNPCEYIPLKNHLKKERVVLNQKEFDKIYEFLVQFHSDYATYMQIFHMSGCRSTELLSVKKEDVNLKKQEFIITVKKRKSHIREIRAIIPEAIPFWKKHLDKCIFDQDYLFGVGFSPELRLNPISNDAPGKYWNRYVVEEFKTDATFYSLKHFFLDKIAEIHGIAAAQGMAGHLNGKTTEIYTVFKKKRELEELKGLTLKKIEGL